MASPSNSSFQRYGDSLEEELPKKVPELAEGPLSLEEFVAIHEELLEEDSSKSTSLDEILEEELSNKVPELVEGPSSLDDVIPASEPESIELEEFSASHDSLLNGGGFHCSGQFELEDESVEQAKNAVATVAYKKYLNALDAIGRI